MCRLNFKSNIALLKVTRKLGYLAYIVIKEEIGKKPLATKQPSLTYILMSVLQDISIRFSVGIRRAGSKRSLKVPLDFPGPVRLRPASQYFSNFLSKSYGTRSIMTSREQSSFSLPRFSRHANPQDRFPCIAGCSFRPPYTQ